LSMNVQGFFAALYRPTTRLMPPGLILPHQLDAQRILLIPVIPRGGASSAGNKVGFCTQ